jgi:hypothetical protein
MVWAAAAGRCTLCKRYILENEDLGEIVPIGTLAHLVGWGVRIPHEEQQNSPRRCGGSLKTSCLCVELATSPSIRVALCIAIPLRSFVG